MYIWYNTKKKTECLSALYFECEYCDQGYDCCDKTCEFYEDRKKEQIPFYNGNMGSSLIGLLSLNIDELVKELESACVPFINDELNTEISFHSWLGNFPKTKKLLGKYWKVFLFTGCLYGFYCLYVLDKTETSFYQMKKFKYHLHDVFLVFQCVRDYIVSCTYDASFYSLEKYLFADIWFFRNSRSLSDFKLNTVDLNFDTKNGRDIHRIKSHTEFISALNNSYENCRKLASYSFFEYDEVYDCERLDDFSRVSIHKILSEQLEFKVCSNCYIPFIAYKRSDALYCDRISPHDNTKTCKEYGARKSYQENLKSNETMSLYRNIYMAKQNLAKRNPDIIEYQESFEKYKSQSKQWKLNVKAKARTEAEYIEWLRAVKEKKVL